MATLFRREDAILLGYMQAGYFNPPVTIGAAYNGSFSPSWGFVIGGIPNTGDGGGLRGETGKARIDDATAFSSSYMSISGYGGTQEEVGRGYQDGKFGLGGGDGVSSYALSCGGGSGWYGGGSSYAGAGGGGGSGYVFTDGSYMPPAYNPSPTYKASGLSAGLQSGVNQGNGKCIINGVTFIYTGKVQTYTIPAAGMYKIECFGAQGGGVNGVSDPKYPGGLGGYASGDFNFPAGLILYIYVGGEGKTHSNDRAWNGGGSGSGGFFGGGGSTDVRSSGVLDSTEYTTNFYDRFIVAGGGGGQGRDAPVVPELNSPLTQPNSAPSGGGYEKDVKTEKLIYPVNDQTIATIELNYQTSLDIPAGSAIKVTIYVDGVNRGSLSKVPLAGGGYQAFPFDFSTWMPPNTPEHWSTIQAVVEVVPSNLSMIIPPKGGLIITLSTKRRINDPAIKDKPLTISSGGVTGGLILLEHRSSISLVENNSAKLTLVESSYQFSAYSSIFLRDVPVAPNLKTVESSFMFEGRTLIVLQDIPVPPNLKSVETGFSVQAGTIIDLKDIPVPPNLKLVETSFSFEGGITITLVDLPQPPNLRLVETGYSVSATLIIDLK